MLTMYTSVNVTEVTNYRTILSQFDKLLEKLIYKRLLNHLEKHKLLSNRQFGFFQDY